jgi:NAD(P)-dependent dehydrogenase (short-subunit alcohol dehydrogenase family)
MKTFANKTVLVTGALTGIGRATALAFARQGANVAISGRDAAKGAALVQELEAVGAAALFVTTDVRDEGDVKRLIEHVTERFGALDVAVNNAGTEGMPAPIGSALESDYRLTFDTNVWGLIAALKYEVPAMTQRGSGTIVNLSSIVGQVGMPGAAIYAASKHAVEGLTKATALEVAATGIRVNAVAPGPVETPMLDRFTGHSADTRAGLLSMMPGKRAATPDEVASAILYLSSPAAAYVNGHVLTMDSGYTVQ